MSNNNEIDELERQMAMLEDIPSNEVVSNVLNSTPVQPVQSAQPVQAQVNTIIPEAQTNLGTFSNQVSVPVQQVVQQQENQNAAAQAVQPSTSVVQPVQSQVNASAQSNIDIFDKEDDLPVFVNLGEDVQEEKIPFIRLKAGESTRIMLFTTKMIPVYTHYQKDLGYFRCISRRQPNGYIDTTYGKAPCCKFLTEDGKEDYAKLKRIIPVIEYPVGKDGKSLLAGKQPQLKFLTLTKPDYDNLMPLLEDEEQRAKVLNTCDFTITVGQDRFKKKTFALKFDTIRGQFAQTINEEIKRCTPELMLQARDEQFKKIPAARIQQVLDQETQAASIADNLMSQEIPTIDNLLQ